MWDFTDYIKNLTNEAMVDRDGLPLPDVLEQDDEPAEDPRFKSLKRANRFSRPDNLGRGWIK